MSKKLHVDLVFKCSLSWRTMVPRFQKMHNSTHQRAGGSALSENYVHSRCIKLTTKVKKYY